MSRPDPRQPAAAMPAAFARAIDLSALKNRATAQAGGGAGATGAAPAADGGSWILARVNADANPRILQAFGAQTLPMVIALAQGQPIADPLTAALPEPQVRQWISSLLDALRDHLPGIKEAEARNGGPEPAPEPAEDPRFVAAEEALAAGDYVAAEQASQDILAVEPGNAEAKAALAQTGLLSRVEQHGPDVISKADGAPDDVAAQRDAADSQLASGDVAGAFTRLVDTVRRTSGDDRTAAREHLVELFTLFPTDDEQVIKARRALAAALY